MAGRDSLPWRMGTATPRINELPSPALARNLSHFLASNKS
jgi:hypothetical protein